MSLFILLAVLLGGVHPASAAAPKPVTSVALPCISKRQMISPSGDQVAVSCRDHTLQLIDIPSGKTQRSFAADEHVSTYNYSRDGRWFAVGLPNGDVEVVPTSGVGRGKRWKADSRRIDLVEFCPDSSGIVVVAADLPGQVWTLEDAPKRIAGLHSEFSGPSAVAFSPDGKLLVTADGDTVIRFYDTSNWQMLHEYRKQMLEMFVVAFTPDGKHVLLGGADDEITVLDATTADPAQPPAPLGDNIRLIVPFGDASDAILVLTDVEGKRPRKMVVWNSRSGKSTPLMAKDPITAGGMVRGQLWLGSANDKTLEIWRYAE